MIRRACRFVLTIGVIAGVVYAVVRVLRGPPAPAFDDDSANRAPEPWAPPEAGTEPEAATEADLEADVEPESEADVEPEAAVEPEVAAEPEVTTNGESSEEEPEPEPRPAEPTPPLDPTASLGTAMDGSSADGSAAPAPPEDRPRGTARTPRTRPIRVRRQTKAPATEAAPWVTPTGGVAPASHPVKAKMKSRIYHLPGMAAYERTVPDRCYVDAAAAEADGLRIAKR